MVQQLIGMLGISSQHVCQLFSSAFCVCFSKSADTISGNPQKLIMLLHTNSAADAEMFIENGRMDGVTGKAYKCELQDLGNISDSALNARICLLLILNLDSIDRC